MSNPGNGFSRARKEVACLRVALEGIAGSGKTTAALDMATELANGRDFAVIDTEEGSASLYADRYSFDVLKLKSFAPADYIAALDEARRAGYPVVILDSISHEWDAVLRIANMTGQAGGWRNATPAHDAFVNAMLRYPGHVIATMRQVKEYQEGSWAGKGTAPKAIGTKAKQREGMDYEFSIVLSLDRETHTLVATKTRCPELDGRTYSRGAEVAAVLKRWLTSAPASEVAPQPRPAEPSPLATIRGGFTQPSAPAEPRPATFGTTDEAAKIAAYRAEFQAADTQARLKAITGRLASEPASIKDGLRGDYTARMEELTAAEARRKRILIGAPGPDPAEATDRALLTAEAEAAQ